MCKFGVFHTCGLLSCSPTCSIVVQNTIQLTPGVVPRLALPFLLLCSQISATLADVPHGPALQKPAVC